MKRVKAMRKFVIASVIAAACGMSFAENIDPYNDGHRYAYGENVGWLNFQPSTSGVQVYSDHVEGYVWAENIGWINLSPTSYGGVLNDGTGTLSGYAWGENVGWINFGPSTGGVSIDDDGNFSGYAWGENIGWINFTLTSRPDSAVQACKVSLEDFANFADDWLSSGSVPGNLDATGDVDMNDFSIFASYFMDFCPDAWPLKF